MRIGAAGRQRGFCPGPPLADVAAGRALLKNYGLAEGESQGLFVPGVRRHPEPGLAFALWDSNGNRSGVVILTINADERNGVSLPGDFRVIGSSDARFAGIQQSRNGENRIAESLPEGLQLAQQYPDSGVIVRMEGDGLPLNISRITGADQVVDDNLTAQLARNVTEKPEDPFPSFLSRRRTLNRRQNDLPVKPWKNRVKVRRIFVRKMYSPPSASRRMISIPGCWPVS
ncbi:conjugative transfer relaxase/helicase TraI domain-containing protein [Pantoea stewartii]